MCVLVVVVGGRGAWRIVAGGCQAGSGGGSLLIEPDQSLVWGSEWVLSVTLSDICVGYTSSTLRGSDTKHSLDTKQPISVRETDSRVELLRRDLSWENEGWHLKKRTDHFNRH